MLNAALRHALVDVDKVDGAVCKECCLEADMSAGLEQLFIALVWMHNAHHR